MGDLWQLGRHRLLCGDATSGQDVARVLAGVLPHLMVTDPPYGVNYDPAWRIRTKGPDGRRLSRGKVSMGDVDNDDRATGARHGISSLAMSPMSGTAGCTRIRLPRV